MKYNVILVADGDRNYYYSYGENGNIEVDELPPYQDINMARSCYYDGGAWVYDEEKYAEITSAEEEAKAEAKQKAAEAAAVPNNTELSEAVIELAECLSTLTDVVSGLQEEFNSMKGGN
jgi:hypothetical protein